MMAAEVCLRVFLCALLIQDVHALPIKGSKSHDQRSGGSDAGGNYGANRGSATGHYAPVSYGVSRAVSKPMHVAGQAPSAPVFVQTAPASGSMSSTMPEAGYPVGFAPAMPAYPVGAGFAPAMASYPVGGPVQAAPASGSVSSTMPEAGYPVGFVPAMPAYPVGGPVQAGAAQSSLPETKWTVDPKIFSEEELANTQSSGPSDMLQAPPPSPPAGPVLQSGETSNVVKEAELGNYQHETEEFGYPATSTGPGQGFPSNPLPYVGVGGYWVNPYPYPYPLPYPYPEFDYSLLYGLYPPGTYTTLSKHHEKGKDYYQNIHYLREHGHGASDTPSDHGSGQQHKIFHQVPHRS